MNVRNFLQPLYTKVWKMKTNLNPCSISKARETSRLAEVIESVFLATGSFVLFLLCGTCVCKKVLILVGLVLEVNALCEVNSH